MLRGLGQGRMKVQNVSQQHKDEVSVGMPIYTCIYPGLLEIPIIVGRISECKPDDTIPLLLDITVEPATDLKRVAAVAVIVSKHP